MSSDSDNTARRCWRKEMGIALTRERLGNLQRGPYLVCGVVLLSRAPASPLFMTLSLPTGCPIPPHHGRAASEEYRAWKIELSGSPPFKVQFERVGHQQEKRHMLDWDDANELQQQVESVMCTRARTARPHY